MKLTYYTIDDLNLPKKRFLRKGWSMQHFDTLEEAIKYYKSLPIQKRKELGLTDGAHVLELVQCVPLFAYELVRYPQKGVCLYKCGNDRHLLAVHAPPHKEKLFGTAGGR